MSDKQGSEQEQTLLEGVKNLDSGTYEQVHHLYFDALYRYAYFRTSNQQLAEDIASDVFLRLLDASKRGKGPVKNLKGWLFRVATFAINDYFRDKYAHQNVELSSHLPSDQPTPAQILDEQLETEWLRRAVGSLPADQQEVIALRFGAELKIKEVAESMGKSAGAVKQLQLRALKSLQKQRILGGQ